MTYTKEKIVTTQNNPAGVRVVLKPAINSNSSIHLSDWLSEFDLSPIWIRLTPKQGVSKAVPVLLETKKYPLLLKSICQQLGNQTIIEQGGKHYEISGIEVDSDDLYDIRLSLKAESAFPKSINRAVHALFFQWIANADSQLAETLHNSDNLPLTISSRLFRANRLEIRITLLTRQLLCPLLWGVNQDLGKKIEIDKIPCLLNEQINLFDSVNYKKLFNVTPESIINFRFHFPTSFKQNNCIQPFPLPELVFSNLLRRWNSFAPAEYQFPQIDWQGMTAAYDLKTQVIKKEVAEIGSVGWVKYEFKDIEQARIATTLAHFANYSGIGRKTALGMGRVQF